MNTTKKLYLASDHAGFELKEKIASYLEAKQINFENLGCYSNESCDYPDFGHKLAEKISTNKEAFGVAICGSGLGMSMVLNRHISIRAARCVSEEDVKLARKHNNANILVLGSRQIKEKEAISFLEKFLLTCFEEGRHHLRISKIDYPINY